MSRLKDSNKRVNLRKDSIKPIDIVSNPVDEQPVAGGISDLSLPKSDGYTESAIPEKIDASHLFVVDGQECICVTATIPQKTKRSL